MLVGVLLAGGVSLLAIELAPLLRNSATFGDAAQVASDVARLVDSSVTAPVDTAHSAGCLRAVADLHGDVQQAEKALQLLNVVDASGKWSAGACTFVQTGDILDRGPDSIPLVKRFATLAKQAEAAGGRVILLYGNHELINLQGDFRYMNPQELARLGADADSNVLERLPPFYKRMASMMSRGKSQQLQKGVAAWAAKLLPDAPLGSYLRAHRQAAAVVGDGGCRTLFVHAGLLPDSIKVLNVLDRWSCLRRLRGYKLLADTDVSGVKQAAEGAAEAVGISGTVIEKLNGVIARALDRCDGATACPRPDEHEGVPQLMYDSGVFWTRAYAHWPEAQLCPRVEEVLAAVGARQAVVGHTPQVSPQTRCNGKVHLIDVGISRAYVGGMAAWSCQNGVVKQLT